MQEIDFAGVVLPRLTVAAVLLHRALAATLKTATRSCQSSHPSVRNARTVSRNRLSLRKVGSVDGNSGGIVS
jgi:hypothetical protein